jgi:asparagine N-glycosylation enzyme membrane subunit Stt3
MSNEPEWRDANPNTENLPNKGRTVILFIVAGIALGILTIFGMRIRPLGLTVGSFTFFYGIMMLLRRRQLNYKPGLALIACGFLLLLANPRFGVVAGFAGYFLVVGAIGLVAFGLIKAIKLAWELGKF